MTDADRRRLDRPQDDDQPTVATVHLDMLMADRLRDWARNITEPGGHDLTQWGDKRFVAARMVDIAAAIEDAIRASVATCEPAED